MDDRLRASFATTTQFRATSPVGTDLYPFQHAGVEYGKDLRDVLIADQPGLGKTVQAIGLLNLAIPKRALIVCPPSLRINWRRELDKWGFWGIRDVVGYTDLVLHPNRFQGSYDMIIYDEAHYMKNPEAKRTKAGLRLRADRRVFLTGTPITSKPIDLWPIIHSIDPRTFISRAEYGQRYCGARFYRGAWHYDGATNLPELQGLLRSSFMVRRKKGDVLKDLPPKVRQIVEFPSKENGNLANLFGKIRKMAMSRKSVDAMQEESNPLFGEIAKARHDEALSKVSAVLSFVKEIMDEHDKILLFAHHRDVIAQLHAGLSEFKPVTVLGGMTDSEKQISVDSLQNDIGCRILIGQIQAAGVGLTMTAASAVVFAELSWLPSDMEQAEDRAHRIGQKDSVLVYHAVLSGSLDARISKALIRKQEIIDQALDSGSASEPLDWASTLASEPEEIEA